MCRPLLPFSPKRLDRDPLDSICRALGRTPFVLEVLSNVDPAELPTLAALRPHWASARGKDSYDIGLTALLDGLIATSA